MGKGRLKRCCLRRGGDAEEQHEKHIVYKSWCRRYDGHRKVKGPAMSDFGVRETYVTYRMYSTVKEE